MRKVGLYKALDGTAYAADIRCPHLGCQWEWNPEKKAGTVPAMVHALTTAGESFAALHKRI